MPKIFEKDGFAFFSTAISITLSMFMSDMTVERRFFNVEGEVELRESMGMRLGGLPKAQRLAEENKALILEKWHEHLG